MAKSLTRWKKVEVLREKLNGKAKAQPKYCFYSLYDKIYRKDVLQAAYMHCRENGGASGVDGESFEDVEAYGLERYLAELAEELRTKQYRPNAVRRVMIPKAHQPGKCRPLGIPTIKDRVVQMACKLLLDPIFEADLPNNMYGYRSGRSAHDAIEAVDHGLRHGQYHVVDGDLSGYFDTIPHAPLMRSVARRISDRNVLWLIREWLKVPVMVVNKKGRTQVISGKNRHQGTPQGGVISPLLANIYFRRFLLAWEQMGFTHQYGSHVVNYADDFVILCRRSPEGALRAAAGIFRGLGLTLNQSKTRVVRAWHNSFDFLGYRFGIEYGRGGRPYLGKRPSYKAQKCFREKVRQLITRCGLHRTPQFVAQQMAAKTQGFWSYFQYGTVSGVRHCLDQFLKHRMLRWAKRKYPKSRGRRRRKVGQAQRWRKIREAMKHVRYSRHLIAKWRDPSLFASAACYTPVKP